MKRYQQLAHDIAALIDNGVLTPGERVPSVRQASKTYRVSPATVYQAYFLLENRGLIHAKPRSGYYVCEHASAPVPPSAPVDSPVSTAVDVNDLVFAVMRAIADPAVIPLGSAFPCASLFPMERLCRSLSKAKKQLDAQSLVSQLPQGHHDLRRQIIQRYTLANVPATLDELIITNGALEGLNLCLQAVTQAGDFVAVQAPAFYAPLQALERLQLNAIEIPVDSQGNLDLPFLRRALEKYPIKACWFMTSFQNPLGTTLGEADKQALVELLTQHRVPLIEDDVYSELYFSPRPVKPAKAFDRQGWVMHCGSFSKSLAPGYRVGWTCAGRFAQQVERLKLMTTLSASLPAQAAIADYLQHGGYDRHLRKLRQSLKAQQQQMIAAITRYFPDSCRYKTADGGYFLWLELPPNVDSLKLFHVARSHNISIAPGPIFSARRAFRHCIRLNYGKPWSADIDRAMQTLGRLVAEF